MPLLVLVDPKVQGGGFEEAEPAFASRRVVILVPADLFGFSPALLMRPLLVQADASMLAKRQSACKSQQPLAFRSGRDTKPDNPVSRFPVGFRFSLMVDAIRLPTALPSGKLGPHQQHQDRQNDGPHDGTSTLA